jgi:SAM-dependent methyltransferase
VVNPMQASTSLNQISRDVGNYYTDTLARYGPTPLGVDWSCRPTQELRFIQLLRLCQFDHPCSINDIGCGYGALRGFLRRRRRTAPIDYLGVDLSPSMVDAAISRWGHLPQTRFECSQENLRCADYCIASGLFNVKLHHTIAQWEEWIASTLWRLFEASRIGFAVNFYALPQATESSPDALYRVDASRWSNHCSNVLNADVELIENYGLREYTLLAKRRQALSN